MGRRSKPGNVKSVSGNPGKRQILAERRLSPSSPAAADPGTTPPAWLTDADARRVWTELWAPLHRMRFVSEVERATFGRYCQYFTEWVASSRQLQVAGMTQEVTTTSGGTWIKSHPLVAIRDQCELRMRDLEDRFGLNPLARFRLSQQLLGTPGLASGDLFDHADRTAADAGAGDGGAIDPLAFLTSGRMN